jgi:FkbM family methyltransferase
LVDLWTNNGGDEGIFVDIGANIGACTLEMLAVTNATVIAFEPTRQNSFYLTQSILKNGWQDRVRVYLMGLGTNRTNFTIYVPKGNKGHAVLGVPVKDSAPQQFSIETVEVNSLDNVLWPAHCIAPQIRLMKMDVEGFEVNVIRGAKRLLNAGVIKTITTEISQKWLAAQNNTAEELYTEFTTAGFKCSPPSPDGGRGIYEMVAQHTQ